MIRNQLLICLFVLFGCQIVSAGYKSCSSCILLRECPEALNAAVRNDSAGITKLKKALCGIDLVDGKELPKVCCSDFIDLNIRIGENDPEDAMNIETHKNLGLLPEACGGIEPYSPPISRIFRGEFSNPFEFPWMTLISYHTGTYKGKKKYEFKCGGSVISSRYVLTAAHCVEGKKIAGVRVGDFNVNTKTDCQGEYPYVICESHLQDIKVKKRIIHEEYRAKPYSQNDIALLRLKKPVDFSFINAKPVCLPKYEALRNISLGGKRGTVAGWGVAEFGLASPILRKVKIPIKNDNECREYYNSNSDTDTNIVENKICAGEDGKDSCKGDSGGPLMLEEDYNGVYRIIQFGIVSFGPQQCGSTTPGVYTDLRKYMKWILDNIKP